MHSCSSAAISRADVEVVSERLLHHDPGRAGSSRPRPVPDHGAEQERRDLEVEDRMMVLRDRRADDVRTCSRRRSPGELHIRPANPLEHVRVEVLAGRLSPPCVSCDAVAPSLESSPATPTIGQFSRPRRSQSVQRAQRHHPAKSPVIPTTTRMSAGSSQWPAPLADCVVGAVVVTTSSSVSKDDPIHQSAPCPDELHRKG